MIQENHQSDGIAAFADEYDRICSGMAPAKRMPQRSRKSDDRQDREGQESSERQKLEETQLLLDIKHRLSACETLLNEVRAHLVSGDRCSKTTTCTCNCTSVMPVVSDDAEANERLESGIGVELESHVVLPETGCHSDTRLAQLMRAVSEGKVRVTVVGIREYLGCAQKTAAELRREVLAQHTYPVLKEGEA